MKKNKLVIAVIAALLIITAVVAAVHLSTRSVPPSGTLQIDAEGKVTDFALNKLDLTPVQGTVVNGKGEEKTVDSQGELLSSVLEKAGVTEYTQVTVTANDEYSVTVTAEEIAETDRVYLLLEDGKQVRLLVFGDSNSKRNVSDVIRLVVE